MKGTMTSVLNALRRPVTQPGGIAAVLNPLLKGVVCQEVNHLGDTSARETAQRPGQGTDSSQPGDSLPAQKLCYSKLTAAAGCTAETRGEPSVDGKGQSRT